METRTLEFMRKASAGSIIMGAEETLVTDIFTDSRHPVAGAAFLALKGERFDGHSFVESVGQSGIRIFIVSRTTGIKFPEGSAVLLVGDTTEAYGRIAAAYRKGFSELVVVAVCGSNGKTTTKDLVASVLAKGGKCIASARSFNNQIGVPKTLLEITSELRYAVVEVGTNHPGELAPLLRMIAPKYGVLTSIGSEHLEFFKDLGGVLAEESALAEVLPPDGVLFVNADSPGCTEILAKLNPRTRRVLVSRRGDCSNADWSGALCSLTPQGTSFTVFSNNAKEVGKKVAHIHDRECLIQQLGAHQITNALLAIAVGSELGITATDIYDALTECPPPEMRSRIRTLNGLMILEDCYNANQDSVCAALETLATLSTKGRRVAILGTMGELGDSASAAHLEVARKAAQLGIEVALFCGEYAHGMAGAFECEAHAPACARSFDDLESLTKEVDSILTTGDCVLVKASRSQRFERVIQKLGASR